MVFLNGEIGETIDAVDFTGLSQPENDFGKFMYGLYSDSKDMFFRSDALSLYPLFVGSADDRISISSNQHFAAWALYGEGYLEKVSVEHALAAALFNNRPPSLASAYTSIFCVPRNAGVIIQGAQLRLFELVPDQYQPITDVQRELEIDEILVTLYSFVTAYHQSGVTGGYITAGYDSRTLLSFLLKTGIAHKLSFSVNGYDDHPDVMVADKIASHFNLGLAIRPPSSTSDVENAFDRALDRYLSFGGNFSFYETWMNVMPGSDAIPISPVKWKAFSGLAGEIFRPHDAKDIFLGDKRSANRKATPEELSKMRSYDLRYLSNSIREDWNRQFVSHYSHVNETYSIDFFREIMNRHWYGGVVHKNNNVATTGAYYRLHRLAFCQAPEKRVTMDLTFRLIDESTPELLSFPFEKSNFSYPVYCKNRPELARLQPVVNTNNRPLPSGAYSKTECEFLFKHYELNSKLCEYLDAKMLDGLVQKCHDANGGTQGAAKGWEYNRMVGIWGLSLLLDNKYVRNLQMQRVDFQPLDTCDLSNNRHMSMMPCAGRKQDADEFYKTGSLLFPADWHYFDDDHAHLNAEEQKIFDEFINEKP
jgi:hypothetical protein